MKLFLKIFISFFYLLIPAPILAQSLAASPAVAIENSVYDDLQLLNAHRLLPSVIQGQKPFTRSYIAFLLKKAQIQFEDLLACDSSRKDVSSPFTVDQLRYWPQADCQKHKPFSARTQVLLKNIFAKRSREFHHELQFLDDQAKQKRRPNIVFTPLQSAAVESVFLAAPKRPHFSYGLQADYQPFVQNRQGREFGEGFQSSIETEHSLTLGNYFSLFFHPRFQLHWADPDHENADQIFVQELYGSFSLWNHHIDVGRRPLHWGQSRYGGVLFSNHARPMDQISITNHRPWDVPILGDLKYTFFVGNLGDEEPFPNPFIMGAKFSIKPWKNFEFSGSRAFIFGGQGAPDFTFAELIQEFFLNRSQRQFVDSNIANSLIGLEFRLDIPPLHGLSLYGEMYFEDFSPSRIVKTLYQDTFILVGLDLPRLDSAGLWSLNLEGRRSVFIMFEHSVWNHGWSIDRHILGDPFGNNGHSIQSKLMRRLPEQRMIFQHTLNLERLDSDTYRVYEKKRGREVDVPGEEEWRLRQVVSLDYDMQRDFSWRFSLGHEYVENFNFLTNNNKHHFFAGVLFNYTPQIKVTSAD